MGVEADVVKFKRYSCFKNEWAGFAEFKAVNVVIGRNNSGKSQLLDFVEWMCGASLEPRNEGLLQCSAVLKQHDVQRVFNHTTSGGEMGGNHWSDHGALMVGKRVRWEIHAGGATTNVTFDEALPPNRWKERSDQERASRLLGLLRESHHEFRGKQFRRLLADRDIQAETPGNALSLTMSGQGATNIIRRYLTSSVAILPRETIQRQLLTALNVIFSEDGQFDEIEVKHHDETSDQSLSGKWEVYLSEEHKGLIQLSRSGSGLKTVILVLLNLLVIPQILSKPPSSFVFAFEELENNLHPALLRRLLRYIESYAVRESATVFLTTHSSVALDLFGLSANATITRVTHDGASAFCTPITAHFDRIGVVSELGARPSDLLQANGIVWVEGPSDRVYVAKWIALFSNGELLEGRDYQCAFYGGALLSRVEFKEPTLSTSELANLLRLNSRFVLICDSDRSEADAPLKDRVSRLHAEVTQIPDGHIWITGAREVENYLTGQMFATALDIDKSPRSPNRYERMFGPDRKDEPRSYTERVLGRKSVDKMELALKATALMDASSLDTFDLREEIGTIVSLIRRWNA